MCLSERTQRQAAESSGGDPGFKPLCEGIPLRGGAQGEGLLGSERDLQSVDIALGANGTCVFTQTPDTRGSRVWSGQD